VKAGVPAKPKPREGWSPAFDHAKQPARLPLQGGQQHVKNIDLHNVDPNYRPPAFAQGYGAAG
jgi:hypothetical protein